MVNHNCVKFVIWQTLRTLPEEEQETRTVQLEGNHGHVDSRLLTRDLKVHFDVIEGDPRPIIARVEADFGPNFLRQRLFVWNRPRKQKNMDGHNDDQPAFVWRCFESRQKCTGIVPKIRFSIVGMGGTILRVKSDPDLEKVEGYFFEKNLSAVSVPSEMPFLQPIPLPISRAFFVQQVSGQLLLPETIDSGMDLVRSMPAFPRKSSWERGEEGINSIRQSLNASIDQDAVTTIVSIQLCEGDPTQKDLQNIIKMSQNFIKYEDAIDKIIQNNQVALPPNQGTIRSNKADVDGDTNRTRHDTLTSCSNGIAAIVKAMNPRENQMYKLMFASDEQSASFVARFCFQGVPDNVDFTILLIRFCTLFVHNSFRFQAPKPLKSSRSIGDEVEFLFSMVIRDRFVEEILLLGEMQQDGDMSLCSLFDYEIDQMHDGYASLPLSVEDQMEEDWFDSFSHSRDGHSRDRKRPRPLDLMPRDDSFGTTNSQSPKVDIVFHSHLSLDNKYYTAAKLATIGKKLSTGTSNNKKDRLERLKDYFDARQDELSKFFENENQYFDSEILGVEFVFTNDASRDDNTICVILQGGRQMIIPRRGVCQSKYGVEEFPIELQQMSEAKAKSIFENLYPTETALTTFDHYVSRIDEFIGGLKDEDSKLDGDPCRFALIHDLFCEN